MFDYIEKTTDEKEWLFQKMAGRFEGWTLKDNNADHDVPLNELDYFAIRLLYEAAAENKRVGLALPRVLPGIGLSLLAYATVNRFIASEKNGVDAVSLIFDGFHQISLEKNTPIVIITKRRGLRDLYTNSFLKFSGQNFLFRNFPLFRIKRDGTLTPLTPSTIDNSINVPPVVFYHLDNIEKIPDEIIGSFVIVEMDSVNTGRTLASLKNILHEINPCGSLAITNLFSSTNIEFLKKTNHQIVPIRPELAFKHRGDEPGYPSLASALYRKYSETDIKGEILQSDVINDKIAKIHSRLNELSDQANGDLPEVFFKARTLLSIFRSLIVDVEDLEKIRKLKSNSKSIQYILEKVFTDYYIEFTPTQAPIFEPVWGAVGVDFFELYDMLKNENPKFTAIKNILSDNQNRLDDLCIVTGDQAQTEVIRAYAARNLTDEVCDNIEFITFSKLNRSNARTKRLLMSGVLPAKYDSVVLNSQPYEIIFLSYKNELPLLKSFLYRIEQCSTSRVNFDQLETFSGINFSEDGGDQEWFSVDKDLRREIDEYEGYSKEQEELEELPEIYYDGFTGVDLSEEESDNEFFIVTTVEGDKHALRDGPDVLIYRDKKHSVLNVSPNNLAPGDRLLTLSEEKNYEIFNEFTARLRELSGADFEIVSIWEQAILELNKVQKEEGIAIVYSMLKILGCKRSKATIKQWLSGDTLAPLSTDDIRHVLKASNKSQSVDELKISEEINKIRKFNRELGKKIRKKIISTVSEEVSSSTNSIDIELDEITDLINIIEIDEISDAQESMGGYEEILVIK